MAEPGRNSADRSAVTGQLDNILGRLGSLPSTRHASTDPDVLQALLQQLGSFLTGLGSTLHLIEADTPQTKQPSRNNQSPHGYSRWESAATEVLQQIFHVATMDRQTYAAVRLVCRSWRSVLDSSMAVLELNKIPDEQYCALIATRWPALTTVDLTKLNKDIPVQYGRVVKLLEHLSTVTTLRNLYFSRDTLTLSKGILQQGLQALEAYGNRAPWHKTLGDRDYIVALPESITCLKQLRHIGVLDVSRRGPHGFSSHDGGIRSLALDGISVLCNLSVLTSLQSLNLCYGVRPMTQIDGLASQLTNLEQHSAMVTSEQLTKFTRLRRLALHNFSSQLSHRQLATALPALASLEELALSHSHTLKEVPISISKLTRLHTLDLSLNNLQSVPIQMSCLTQLTSLSISGNLIRIFPEALVHLTGLRKLDLSRNSWRMDVLLHSVAFQSFCTHAKLTDLNMSLSRLSLCPPSLMCLESLQHLQLERNKLRSLPSFLHRLTNLLTLDLGHNHLDSLPCITALTKLRYLNVRRNSLQQLQLPRVPCLRYLNATHNSLQAVPPGLITHSHLHYLNLSHNPISCSDMALGRLGELQELQLQGLGADGSAHLPGYSHVLLVRLNWDAVWREETGGEASTSTSSSPPRERHLDLALLQNLEQLNLSNNLLRAVPPKLSLLCKLRHLNLSNAALSTLHPALWQLQCLTHLDLSANHIPALPDQVAGLRALKLLDLSSNALRSVSPAVWQLRSLQVLGLCANRLTHLPEVPAGPHRLQVLDVRFNSLHDLPSGLISLSSSLHKLLLDSPLDTWPAASRLKVTGVKLLTSQQLSVQHYASHLLHSPPPPLFVSHMVRPIEDPPRGGLPGAGLNLNINLDGIEIGMGVDVLDELPGLPWELQHADLEEVVALMGVHDGPGFGVLPGHVMMGAFDDDEELHPFLPPHAELFGTSDESA